VFVNYVSGVKLYNQPHRYGGGFPSKLEDFLDALDEPPRVSIRRRMIRTIMDAARADYSRWYILAHSLGSLVAFNGLMETGYRWPGYFNEWPWFLIRHLENPDTLVGQVSQDWVVPDPHDMSPSRPVWAESNEIAYRSHIFRNFHGLLTFGSPLEKFATIWPWRVGISSEPAFRPGTRWFNIYDPIDPVSGVLRSFSGGPQSCCPEPENIGYAAGSILLVNHLKCLARPKDGHGLVDSLADWLVTGNADRISAREVRVGLFLIAHDIGDVQPSPWHGGSARSVYSTRYSGCLFLSDGMGWCLQ
jgi:hypothetical protein